MRFRQLLYTLMFCIPLYAVQTDSLRLVLLPDLQVRETFAEARNRTETLQFEVVGKDFLFAQHAGSLVQTLNRLPGIHSMNIGSGFSKPSIRGMAFNRVAVIENGVKQEGQQWGADHGLEIDAFNVERVEVRKGPASLQFGSDAMGGVIELKQNPIPTADQLFGELIAIGQTNNNLWGTSALLGLKKNAWFARIRFTEQHFGDYGVPTDTIVYLTRKLPIYNRKLKNTAGMERTINSTLSFSGKNYRADAFISNAYQKTGFFSGAHGIPDASRLLPDSSSRDIDLPYSSVNHLKIQLKQTVQFVNSNLNWDIAYQNNHRKELSKFHTHYDGQVAPSTNPDLELEFQLNTWSSTLKWQWQTAEKWTQHTGIDIQYQNNRINGYGFLLPEFRKMSAGLYLLSNVVINNKLTFSGGVRYDTGKSNIEPFTDTYLEEYLKRRGLPETTINTYKQRSYAVNRGFGDFSGSIGMVFTPSKMHTLKANIGRSFRLPGANELASNGVHHGTFRHEQGNPLLPAERAWQLDAGYTFNTNNLTLIATPFVNWFDSYIYLKPTGEWSILPHAGQIYRYTAQEALFVGGEFSLNWQLFAKTHYSVSADYVYTYNLNEHTPLSFSPPANIRNTFSYESKYGEAYVEHQFIGYQKRVARNEETTPGAQLFHAGVTVQIPIRNNKLSVGLSIQNILNTKYYNHLSFYRKVEIPEPGRNLQLIIKLPIQILLK